MSETSEDIGWSEKIAALTGIARFRPRFTGGLILLGGTAAFLEGVGLSFIHPILRVAQSDGSFADTGGFVGRFADVYDILGIPFTLEFLILGVAGVMSVRFTLSFFVAWLREILRRKYEQKLKRQAFSSALEAEVGYFDTEGSDEILNTIITETRFGGDVIKGTVQTIETLALVFIYASVMVYLSPVMTLYVLVLLGGITYVIRYVVKPAYTFGSRVAAANERVQRFVQSGTQGIRDVKMFGLLDETYEAFDNALRQYTDARIDLARNRAAIQNFYDLASALILFSLIYIGFIYSGLSLGALSIFLLAMFRISPLVSRLNSSVYAVEGNLSHLVRTQTFVEELESVAEEEGALDVSRIETIEFEDVAFAYEPDEQVLDGISFEIERGDFVAFVGQSGAGKSTIVSLISRFYEPNQGEIRADGRPIDRYGLEAWRSRIAVVRQQPFIFNDTLERNITVGSREATRKEVERVCKVAKVDEFVDDLPDGYDSQLGDDGVRLSGGQRQRVALARALLTDADFLLLDEATSDLDSNLEREVQAAIEATDSQYGIVAVAHRLSTVKNADRIYTLSDGRIIERGTHQELLNGEGKYAELYAIQSGA
jgi:subfamily B ATP-binding cassette protein MsbA